MKKKIICMAIIFSLMLIIPFFTVENKENFSAKDKFLSKNQVCELLSNEFRTEYNTETLKVLAIILQSNYKADKFTLEYMSKDDFYNKYGEKSDEYYKKIKEAANKTYKKIILHKKSEIYIPYSYVLKSSTDNSDMKYFKNVATPWDCLRAEYTAGATEGISLNSVNQLCKNGYSYEKALNYFMNDIEITAP